MKKLEKIKYKQIIKKLVKNHGVNTLPIIKNKLPYIRNSNYLDTLLSIVFKDELFKECETDIQKALMIILLSNNKDKIEINPEIDIFERLYIEDINYILFELAKQCIEKDMKEVV